MKSLSTKLAATLASAAILAVGVGDAVARGGVPAVNGTCTAGSTIKGKAAADNGQLQVDFEVDQNKNGVTWNWTIARSTALLASGTAVTKAPSGAFSVRRLVSLGPVQITATRAGEVCTVSLS